MELSVEVFWASDDRLADTTQELDFNGTVITQKIKPLPMPGPNEMAANGELNKRIMLNKFTGGLV